MITNDPNAAIKDILIVFQNSINKHSKTSLFGISSFEVLTNLVGNIIFNFVLSNFEKEDYHSRLEAIENVLIESAFIARKRLQNLELEKCDGTKN